MWAGIAVFRCEIAAGTPAIYARMANRAHLRSTPPGRCRRFCHRVPARSGAAQLFQSEHGCYEVKGVVGACVASHWVSMGSIRPAMPLQYRALAIVAQTMASIDAATGFCDRVFLGATGRQANECCGLPATGLGLAKPSCR